MPPIVILDKVSLAFGHIPLLDVVDLQIDAGERICLVGRNGTGKTTLLRLISGEVKADDGTIWHRPGIKISTLTQEMLNAADHSVFDVVAGGLEQAGKLITQYHKITQQLETNHTNKLVERLGELQQQLDASDAWRLEQRVAAVISRLGLSADLIFSNLSGGYQRRTVLARSLVIEPDLLLLDEPTNHLDIDGIKWLEEYLLNFNGAILLVTHDRSFLKRLATRIIDLDRGRLSSWPGDYRVYQQYRTQQLNDEAAQDQRFDKKLAQEELWIRQGIKARRTRNEGRVRALQAMRTERAQRRTQSGRIKLGTERGIESGKLVVEADGIGYVCEDEWLFKDFSTRILRGDRVGIIGANGVGKTTLLKVLLGQLEVHAGSVKLGTKLQIAYFDQQREQLDLEKTVRDNLNQGSDMISIGGRMRHVVGYLQDFLFPPQQIHSPVKSLSGGERNRLLLARLFAKPANVLVMDEPTNDLDVETLELLEEFLIEYDGTLLLVSHDREFLDNVITSTLVFEEPGRLLGYVGGYSDWLRQRQTARPDASLGDPASIKTKNVEKKGNKSTRKLKLSYKEQRELKKIPEEIERLELEKAQIEQKVTDKAFYRQDRQVVAATLNQLDLISKALEVHYHRWEVLESNEYTT